MERTKKIRTFFYSFIFCAVPLALAGTGTAFAKNDAVLPPAVQEALSRAVLTPAEKAFLHVAALQYDIPGYTRPKNQILKCGMGEMAAVRIYWNSYSPDEKKILFAIIQRPPLDTSIVSPLGKFRIHYDTSNTDPFHSTNASDQDYINNVAIIADSCYNYEITTLGYPTPHSDGNLGGDSLYDIYVYDLYDQGYYGFSNPDTNDQLNPGDTLHPRYTAWFAIDNSYGIDKFLYTTHGLDGARVTIAHEFFHVIQMEDYGIWLTPFVDAADATGNIPNRYFYEMSSVWMETVVYPGIPDYFQYIPWLFTNITDYLQLGITPANDIGYSMGLIFHYADRLYQNDHSIIKQIWFQDTLTPPLQAMDNAFRARGSSLADFWCGFCTSLLYTDSRANDTLNYYSYDDARKYPPVQFRQTQPFVPQSLTDSIHVLTSVYYAFSLNTPTHDTLYAVVTNIDVSDGFKKDLTLKKFTLNIGQGYPNPIPGTNLTYQFLPDLNNWCVTLTKASIDESGVLPPYPNPFIVDGTSQISFPIKSTDVPKKVELKIFTESGRLAYSNSAIVPIVQSGRLVAQWNGEQNSGGEAQSGVYIYMLNVDSNLSEGKIAIIRK
jgi:hypothetical protein